MVSSTRKKARSRILYGNYHTSCIRNNEGAIQVMRDGEDVCLPGPMLSLFSQVCWTDCTSKRSKDNRNHKTARVFNTCHTCHYFSPSFTVVAPALNGSGPGILGSCRKQKSDGSQHSPTLASLACSRRLDHGRVGRRLELDH